MPDGNAIPVEIWPDAYDFLHKLIVSDEWAAARHIYCFTAPHVWQNYLDLHLDVDNFREVKLIRQKLKAVETYWKLNNRWFGRTFNAKEEKWADAEATPEGHE